MKAKLKHFLWFFLLGAGYAQIVIPSTGGGGQCTAAGGTTSCSTSSTATINIEVGDTVIALLVSNNAGTNAVASQCSLPWPTPIRNASGGMVQTLWIVPHATTAVSGCQIQVTGLQGASSFIAQVYRNVLTVGTPVVTSTSVTNATQMFAPISTGMTASAVGNLLIGMFFVNQSGSSPFTPVSPATIRRSTGTTVPMVMTETTATTTSEPTVISITPSVASTYMRAAVELTPAPTNRIAHLNDAMQTILMNASRNLNYQLPSAGLSATWCTWFMPINTGHDYELQPEASTQVNGQTSHVKIPAWQMTRICQDANGHFWASPPLLAGTGISITPSPLGVTISSTSTSGISGMTYIAGGVTHIPGTVAVPADTCQTIYTSDHGTTPNADGVRQSDVVSFSLQPSASGWNNGKTFFHPIAYAGSISWRACNTDTTNYTPSARDVNWYVARASVGSAAARHRTVHKSVPKSGERSR